MKMNVKIIVTIFTIGLITLGHAQLSCYVCENCPDGKNLSDELIMSCGEEATTAPTVSPSTSTEPPISSTDDTTTTLGTSTTENSTTETPPEVSTEPSTESSTEISTEPSTEPTTQGTEPSLEPSIETTANISTVTTPEVPITTTPAEPGTEGTINTPDITTPTIPSGIPTTTNQPTGTPPFFRQNASRQTAYNCFVIIKEVNGTEQVNRGCVVASPTTNDMCTRANENVMPIDCHICATDKCNSSSGIVLSVFLLLFSICSVLSL